jgi:hypothetical protein
MLPLMLVRSVIGMGKGHEEGTRTLGDTNPDTNGTIPLLSASLELDYNGTCNLRVAMH